MKLNCSKRRGSSLLSIKLTIEAAEPESRDISAYYRRNRKSLNET